MLIRGIKRFLLIALSLYLIGGALLYFVQDKILFHPQPLSRDHRFSFAQPFQELNISFDDNNVSIVKFALAKPKGLVLFYHGNMDNVEHYGQYPSIFLRNDYEVWMIDYPGFGKTTGKRTEKIMDREALFMYALAAKETSSDRIVIFGKSIGTGLASYVASKNNCRRLILETPYYDIASLAKHYFPFYPVNSMINYSFPIHAYLKNVKAPVTIFHGTTDEVIPYQHSEWLKEEYKKIELVSIENGKHNNLSSYALFQKKMDSLLSR